MASIDDGPPFGPIVNGTMVVVFWEYRPSNIAAYSFLGLFALATLAHIVYFFRLRAWVFIPFVLGGVCQIFGYYERSEAHSAPRVLRPWILQNMLLLVSPPLLAATVYMSYGRISSALLYGTYRRKNPHKDRNCCTRCCVSLCCTCSPTKAYVLVDIVAIFTQLIGTVLPASGTPEAQRLSVIVVLIGLLAQMLALGAFLVFCVRLHARLRRDPARWSRAMVADPAVNWLGYFVVMEMAGVMLVVRSVMRGVEYLQGMDGYVASHEWCVYVFDAVPMLVVMVGFLVLYPPRLVREVAHLEKIEQGVGECVELRGGSGGSGSDQGNA
ncbi:RTA1-domain-containing protein [Parathielavia appendiculata]|uniref:RTA1-domain-containing protein n=1 Tax=Parathielavia appendiculata TaxID=2587402 RepID=A0AAN6U5L0_9PEZI|nr:RTA1-domain-containing protein [Parathielavia appendiculata]